MELYYIIGIVAIILMAVLGYWIGSRGKSAYEAEKRKLENEKLAKETELSQKTDEIKSLTADRDVQKNLVEMLKQQIDTQKEDYERRIKDSKIEFEKQKNLLAENFENRRSELASNYKENLEKLKASYDDQVDREKKSYEKQIKDLKELNDTQVTSQLNLIKEQMQSTSEKVLKERQKELGENNNDLLSKILGPLNKDFKDMKEAFETNKKDQKEALDRLDQTIQINMEKNAAIGETADRLSRALTGEVKVQGNFGELKLKQLLEDLELKEGEQFFTQEHLKDLTGKEVKGDDGKGMIPDFVLRFPNERYVVVDSKMSLTDFERYMSAEEGSDEKRLYLQAHLASVRAQVKRLAKKDYTNYLPKGYNRLTFAIMYIPIEGALNLAILNDTTLWQEAYEQGVMILGPQTMYMNLRVLEMMWTQVRQLENQDTMINAANTIIERVQDFGKRFMEVESSMKHTFDKMNELKITTSDNGRSIITAAKTLLKSGGKEKNGKKTLNDISNYFDENKQLMLSDTNELPGGNLVISEKEDMDNDVFGLRNGEL